MSNDSRFYTNLKQSETLSAFLLESTADMFYPEFDLIYSETPSLKNSGEDYFVGSDILCWSLDALFKILKNFTLDSSDNCRIRIHCKELFTEWHENAIDACFEMILKLNNKHILIVKEGNKL